MEENFFGHGYQGRVKLPREVLKGRKEAREVEEEEGMKEVKRIIGR